MNEAFRIKKGFRFEVESQDQEVLNRLQKAIADELTRIHLDRGILKPFDVDEVLNAYIVAPGYTPYSATYTELYEEMTIGG